MASISIDNVLATVTWPTGETTQVTARFDLDLIDVTRLGGPPQLVMGEWSVSWEQADAHYPGEHLEIASPFVSGKAISTDSFLFGSDRCEIRAVGVGTPTLTLTNDTVDAYMGA